MIARVAIAAAIAVAAVPAIAQAPATRPAAELHCIYDSASEAVIARAGERIWNDDVAAAELLVRPGRACARRHGWSQAELAQAAGYAVGTAVIHHVRTRLAQSYPVASWDAIYAAVPAEERVRRNAPPMDSFTDGAMRAMADDPAAWSARPDTINRMGFYLGMRRTAEQAERAWAGLPVPD